MKSFKSCPLCGAVKLLSREEIDAAIDRMIEPPRPPKWWEIRRKKLEKKYVKLMEGNDG